MLELRTQSECSSMSEINKMDAVMFFVDFPFLKNDSLKLNIVGKIKCTQNTFILCDTSFSQAVTDPKSVKQTKLKRHRNQVLSPKCNVSTYKTGLICLYSTSVDVEKYTV
jgi:hypothetical protein